jgi:hypothetical protein
VHALYRGLLATALSFLTFLALAALTVGTTWTLQNRATILAASLELGGAVGLRTRRA